MFVKDDPERAFYGMLTPSSTAVPFSALYDDLARLCVWAKRPVPPKRVVSAGLKEHGFTLKEGHARKLLVYATLDADAEHGE